MKVHDNSNRGVALPTVIMVMLVAFSFAAIVLTMAVSQAKTEVVYENSVGALHAAEAGINWYLSNLNKADQEEISSSPIGYPNNSSPQYFYQLEEMDVAIEGKRVVKSSGWVCGKDSVKRTIEVTFIKRSFTEYMYFSNNDGEKIYWTTGDACYGPYRTNGKLYIMGTPNFFGKVIHSKDIVPGDNYGPVFWEGEFKESALSLPSGNTKLSLIAQKQDHDNSIKQYYMGRTCILFNGDKMTIRYSIGDSNNLITMDIPDDCVIYVDGISSDANTNTIFDPSYGNVFISGCLDGRVTVAATNDIYITDYDPTEYDLSKASETNGLTYKNTIFKVISDSNNPDYGKVIQDPLGDDMLGLIAAHDVCVLTKGWFSNGDIEKVSAVGDINVDAAIMAIKGSFKNSDGGYNPENNSKLIVRGSIIQNIRGIVGHDGSQGYKKDYAHDPRMMYDSPPYFIEPANSGWKIDEWKE
jgi:hypothetical protein